MADETRHARLCYGLAARYSGDARGPGPLDVTGALADSALLAVVERAVLEGCIGETQAAVVAAWAAELATDPVVREVLDRIAEDETRHAALAFDFVAWASERDATVRSLVERTFASARAAAESEPSRERASSDFITATTAPLVQRTLAAHGVLDAATRKAARRAALCDVLPSVFRAALGRSESAQQELLQPARSAHPSV
jgi:rubrerythrin